MERRRELAIIVAILVAIIAGAAFLLTGGQTSRILSSVGSPVGTPNEAETPVSAGAGHDSTVATAPADPNGAGPGVAAASGAVPPPALLIVRSGTLTLRAPAIAPIVSSAAAVVTASGGFVAGSKESGADDRASAVVDYRIPAEAWEPTLAELRRLGTVAGQEITAEEVTGQVVDLAARISNLRASETALQVIMARATKISDVLDIQKQLTETRGEIEELTGQKDHLEDRASFGSLSVTFEEPPSAAPIPTARPGWNPAQDVSAASARLVRIGQKAATAGIWFGIVGVPLLAAFGLGSLFAWLAYRAARRIRRVLARESATGQAT